MYVLRTPEIKERCLQEIKSLPLGYEVDIREHKSTRSTQQNRLYWKIITIIGDHCGLDREDMHRTFAIRLLEPDLFVVDGKQYVGAKSTTKLSTKEFTEYLDKIYATGAVMGLKLPTPGEMGLEI